MSLYLAGRGWQVENRSNAGIFAGKWASSPRSGEIDSKQPRKRRLEAALPPGRRRYARENEFLL